MKYDIYKGSKEDFEGSGGELVQPACDITQVGEFCKKQFIHGLNNLSDFINGKFIPYNGVGYWLEEAM